MVEPSGQDVVKHVDDPMAEVVATTGLLLMFVAVIGMVMGIAAFGMGSGALGAIVVVIAVVSFSVSLACFVIDARRLERAEAA